MNSYVALGLVLAAGGAVGSAGWYGYDHGKTVKQAEWDAQKLKDVDEAAKVRNEGFEIAAEYETQLTELRRRYARANVQRPQSLSEPVICPASGRIGDLAVPAAAVRSMFNIPEPEPAASGPASSEPPG